MGRDVEANADDEESGIVWDDEDDEDVFLDEPDEPAAEPPKPDEHVLVHMERKDHGKKHKTHGNGRRDFDTIKYGANYCTAHGWDCNCTTHDTHTRIMPHERRNGILTADSTVALICSFFAVDALSTLSEFTFALPDWGAGECPGICDPEADLWTKDTYEQEIWDFNHGGWKNQCPEAEDKWKAMYQIYTLCLAVVASCGLVCAIQNATTVASGTYLLYDALNEKTLEKHLADRFDRWWHSTQVCRWVFSRLSFLLTATAYMGAMYFNPALTCASDDFSGNVDQIKFIAYAAGGCFFLVYFYSKLTEKCFMVMGGGGPISDTFNHCVASCGGGGCCDTLQCASCAKTDCCFINFCRCFTDLICSCMCQYQNCHCCGEGPSCCIPRKLSDDEIYQDNINGIIPCWCQCCCGAKGSVDNNALDREHSMNGHDHIDETGI